MPVAASAAPMTNAVVLTVASVRPDDASLTQGGEELAEGGSD